MPKRTIFGQIQILDIQILDIHISDTHCNEQETDSAASL